MTSASTLSRRARDEKNPKKAKALRAQAAKLRREEREATAAGIARAQAVADGWNKPGKAANKIIAGLNQALNHALDNDAANDSAARAASVDSMPLVNQPGRGEIVGGDLAKKAEELAKLARKKGGIDEIQRQLELLEMTTRHAAQSDMTQRMNTVAKDSNKRWGDAIVTGFMARCLGMEAANGRGLPDYIVIDGVTLARVVDALSAAGYTASGKR